MRKQIHTAVLYIYRYISGVKTKMYVEARFSNKPSLACFCDHGAVLLVFKSKHFYLS